MSDPVSRPVADGTAGPVAADLAQLLNGVPYLNPAVETLHDPQRGCALSWKSESGNRRGWRALLMGPVRRRRLELDDLGRRTVELCDGRRRVGEIAAQLAAEHQVELGVMQRATLAFLAELVRRNAAQIVDDSKEIRTGS